MVLHCSFHIIENQKPILGADRAKKLATVYRALRPSPKVVHAKDFTSTEGAGDNNPEPQQREPESLTSDNDEDVGWPLFSDGE